MKVLRMKKPVEKQPTTPKPFPSSDLLIEPAEELRKVRSTVTLLAALGSPQAAICEPEAVLGFCELIEERLQSISQDIESAITAFDAAHKRMREDHQANRRAREQ